MKPSDQPAAVAALRGICKKLPGAEEYVMVHHPAFRVGKKPFVIAGMEGDGTRSTLSVNLGPDAQGHLLGDERFTKTHYIGQHGWVTVGFARLSKAELTTLVIDSYRRVAGKKLLAQLDGSAPARAVGSGSPSPKSAPKKRAARAERRSAARSNKAAADSGEWLALGLAAPARRALLNAGIESLTDLRTVSEASLRQLHGMGPSALKLIAAAMAKSKLRFAAPAT